MRDKQQEYQRLIQDVKSFYKGQEHSQTDPIYLTWWQECREINLWTYWQGRESLDAKILLVGQDWGCPQECSRQYMAQFPAIDNGMQQFYRRNGESITDNNLTELFHSIGYEIGEGERWNPDLFFTNFVLGYRNKGLSGHFKRRWLRENKDFFLRLANIVEPEIIICLGRNVFDGVMMAFDKKVRCRGYNAFLTGKDNPVAVTLSCGKQVYVFAQAHCGAMGTLNRNRPKDPSGAIGLELQKKDWSKMKAYFTPSCDHSAQEKEY